MEKKIRKDLVLSGYRIPAGTFVVATFFHFDQEKYFNEPHRMTPERWMKTTDNEVDICPFSGEAKEVPSKFTVLPFGHGARACIGRRIAESLLLVFLSKFVNKYKILPLEKGKIRTKYNMLNVVDEEVKLSI